MLDTITLCKEQNWHRIFLKFCAVFLIFKNNTGILTDVNLTDLLQSVSKPASDFFHFSTLSLFFLIIKSLHELVGCAVVVVVNL